MTPKVLGSLGGEETKKCYITPTVSGSYNGEEPKGDITLAFSGPHSRSVAWSRRWQAACKKVEKVADENGEGKSQV